MAEATTRTLIGLAGDRDGVRHGLRAVLGAAAWHRLPEAVRERFADHAPDVTYAGGFEIVRASLLGRMFAWLGVVFGAPIAPRVGNHVEARVHVRHHARGVDWIREYRWRDGSISVVRSTKTVEADGRLVERLPARLCMALATREHGGALHFASRGYYFDLGVKLPLPAFFTPGITHVEHVDLGHGWFRFTMEVRHPVFGEVYFQTGRFCATEDVP